MSPPTVASPPTGVGVVTEITTLSANELRYLAEKADGLRGDLSLVKNGDGKVDVVKTDELQGQTELLRLDTKPNGPGVPGTVKIHLRTADNHVYGGPGTDLEIADAVFVTQSAVEKFMLPYYTRFKSPDQIDRFMKTAYKDEDILAIMHTPWSDPLGFPSVGGVKLGRGALDRGTVTVVPL
jgi:hypothetical protein